jgi:C4-dicarboxylate transporter DctM subunit
LVGSGEASGQFRQGDTVFLRIVDHLEEWIIATLMAAATGLIFVAVVHRYGTGISIDLAKWLTLHGMTGLAAIFNAIFKWLVARDLSWAQELCIYMFVWMAKFGAAYGVRTGIHVGVDVFVHTLDERHAKRVVLFGLICGAIFTGTIAVLGADFVYYMHQTGQQSNDLEAPMWIVYLAIPLGSALMCFRFLQVAVVFARTGALPHHDQAHVEGVDDVLPAAVRTGT